MPGPVSDSHDPEFGTGANAQDVRDAIEEAVAEITRVLGPDLKNIVAVAHDHGVDDQKLVTIHLTEKDLRMLRFAALRSLDSI